MGLLYIAPLHWNLTPAETRVLGVLLRRGQASKDQIMAGLYRDFGKDEPQTKIVDVFVCKLRAKLRRHGIEISTLWGRGYAISPEMRGKIAAEWPTA
jgi:DNA-binding response OmpR family regulator